MSSESGSILIDNVLHIFPVPTSITSHWVIQRHGNAMILAISNASTALSILSSFSYFFLHIASVWCTQCIIKERALPIHFYSFTDKKDSA